METTVQLTDFLKVQSIQIAAVFAVVLILHWILRHRSAHIRYLLWLLVAVKCMTPPLVSFSVPVLPALSQPAVVAPAEDNHAEAWTPNTNDTISPGISPQENNHAKAWTPNENNPARSVGISPAEDKHAEAWTTNAMMAAVWSIGATLYFLWAIAKSVLLHRRLSVLGRPLPESMAEQIDTLARLWQHPVRFRVRLAESISQPFVWGLWRGAIYLPARVQSIETDRQRAVVMHEMAHVVRLDAFVNLLQILVQGIFWFHPLVWIANRFIRAEREKCCDETAVACLGTAPKEYGSAIVDTLLQEYQAGLPIPTLAVAGPVKNIEDRIKTIMHPNKRFYTRPTAIATLAILTLAVLIVPTTVALTQKGGAKFFIDTTQGYMRCDVKIEELDRALLDMARTYQFNHDYAKNVGFGDNGPHAKYFTIQYTLPDTKKLRLEAVSENKQPLIIRISLDDGACYTLDEITVELARRLKLLPNAKPLPVASLKASDSITPNAEQETQNFTATLPNGVTVKLVGICDHPSDGKQWWSPDGHLLDESRRPYQRYGGKDYSSGHVIYEVAFQVTGSGSDDAVIIVPEIGMGSSMFPGGITGMSLRTKPEVEEISFKVGVGCNSWQTEHEAIRHKISTTWSTTSFGGAKGTAAFGGPYEKDGKTWMTVSHNIDSKVYNINFVAVDKDGNEIRSFRREGGGGDGFSQITAGFDIPLDKVETFRLQTREYQWVTFKNVALRPGGKTMAALTQRNTPPDYTLSGMVADVNDKPIAGAIVFDDGYGPQPYQKGTTGADGKFEYKSWNEEHNVTAKADGFQPQTRVFTTAPFDNSKKLNFKLKKESEDRSQETEEKIAMLSMKIKVVDEDGSPIVGAEIHLDGLRTTEINSGHYFWVPEKHGEPKVVLTDQAGFTEISYPKYVTEKLKTGQVSFGVRHPEYCPNRIFENISRGDARPVVLKKGAIVRVSGYIGDKSQLVAGAIYPQASSGELRISPDQWKEIKSGVYESKEIESGSNYLRLVHFTKDGKIYFSETLRFEAQQNQVSEYNLELKPGVRVEGQLDKSVPRPVTGGKVFAMVAPAMFEKIASLVEWATWSTVDINGMFVFESLPSDQLQLTGLCDGFVAANPDDEAWIVKPQLFALDKGVVKIELQMKPTAICEVKVVDNADRPIPGAKVMFGQNIEWQGGGTQLFPGYCFKSEDIIAMDENELRNLFVRRWKPNFQAITNKEGIAVVRNLPGLKDRFYVSHDDYEMNPDKKSGRPQEIVVDLVSGKTTTVTVEMKKKWKWPFSKKITENDPQKSEGRSQEAEVVSYKKIGRIQGDVGQCGEIIGINGCAVWGNEIQYSNLYRGAILKGAKIELMDTEVIQGNYNIPQVKVKVLSRSGTVSAGTIGWVQLSVTSFAEQFISLEPSIISSKIIGQIQDDPNQFGRIINKYGDAVYGSNIKYTPELGLGHVKFDTRILLMDSNVFANQFGQSIIKIKTVDESLGLPAGTIGWVQLSETSFIDRYKTQPTNRTLHFKLPLAQPQYHWKFTNKDLYLSGKLILRIIRDEQVNEIVVFNNGKITEGWEVSSKQDPQDNSIYFGFYSTTKYLTAYQDRVELELFVKENLDGIGSVQTGVLKAGIYKAEGKLKIYNSEDNRAFIEWQNKWLLDITSEKGWKTSEETRKSEEINTSDANSQLPSVSPQTVNAKLPGKNPICFDKQPQGNPDIGLLARIEEVRQYSTEVKGDWKNYWYFIRCSILQNTIGEHKDKELAFICYDRWPTPESGIMLKKAPFPYVTGRIFHFWLQTKMFWSLPQIVGQEQRSPVAPYEKLNRPEWNLNDPAQKEAFDKINKAAMLFSVKNSEHVRGDSSHVSQIHQTDDYYIVESTTSRNLVWQSRFVLIDKKTFQASSLPQAVALTPNSELPTKNFTASLASGVSEAVLLPEHLESHIVLSLKTGQFISEQKAKETKEPYLFYGYTFPPSANPSHYTVNTIPEKYIGVEAGSMDLGGFAWAPESSAKQSLWSIETKEALPDCSQSGEFTMPDGVAIDGVFICLPITGNQWPFITAFQGDDGTCGIFEISKVEDRKIHIRFKTLATKPEVVSQEAEAKPEVPLDSKSIQTVTFMKDMPLTEALRMLSKMYKVNIIPSQEAANSRWKIGVTHLYDVNFEQILKAVCGTTCTYEIKDDFIYVYTNEEYKAVAPNK